MEKPQRLRRWVGLLGPGLLTALADNDAGGVLSYTITGAAFGYSFFLPLLCGMVFLTYTVQEMAMRLGVAAEQGFPCLVKARYGPGWMCCLLLALLLENIMTLMTELIGMSAGLVFLGMPLWAAVAVSTALVLALTLIRSAKLRERIALLIGLMNVVFLVLTVWMQPDWGAAIASFLPWNTQDGTSEELLWYAIAMIGNAIAPWMIFYQNSAYTDRHTLAKEIRKGKWDTLIGCLCQTGVAICLLLLGAVLHYVPGIRNSCDPADLISLLGSQFGSWAAVLFGIGLFHAGLLAAVTVSLSSSWSVAQAFGWSRSPQDSIRQSPGFYLIYWGSVLLAAGLVLLPGLPLNQIAVAAQVLSAVLMLPVLFFLQKLTQDASLMGSLCSTKSQRIRGWIVLLLLGLASLGAIGLPLFQWITA